MDLVSIIIPYRKKRNFISNSIKSVLNQTYANFELIIIYDDENESDLNFINEFQKKDNRISVIKNIKQIGAGESRNLGINYSKGKFIAFLDADDWWSNDYLTLRKKFFKSSKMYGFSYSNCFHYFQNLNKYETFYHQKMPSGYILDNLLKYYFIKISSVIIKKNVLKKYQFNPVYNIIGDYDLILKIAERYKGMGFQKKFLNIRIHKDNFTHNNRKMFYEEFLYWIKNQNFNNKIFKKNKDFLFQKLEYLRLIYLLHNKKRLGLIQDILKYPNILLKLKLILIFILPRFILRFKHKYS